MERASAIVLLAVHRGIAEPQLRMLRDGDVHDGPIDLFAGEDALRPREIHPWPAAELVRFVGPLRLDDGEERFRLVRTLLLLRDNDRPAIQLEPRIFRKSRLVDGVVDISDGLAGGRVRVEHHLRNSPSVVMVFLQNAHDELGVVFVDHGVRRVEEKKIDAALHDEFHVMADDPFVVGVIVSVKRLAPMVVHAFAAPYGAVRLVARIWISRKDFRHIIGLVAAMFAEPEEVEKADQRFFGGI